MVPCLEVRPIWPWKPKHISKKSEAGTKNTSLVHKSTNMRQKHTPAQVSTPPNKIILSTPPPQPPHSQSLTPNRYPLHPTPKGTTPPYLLHGPATLHTPLRPALIHPTPPLPTPQLPTPQWSAGKTRLITKVPFTQSTVLRPSRRDKNNNSEVPRVKRSETKTGVLPGTTFQNIGIDLV